MNRETMGHFAAKFDESCIVAGAKNAHESLNLGPTIVSFPDLSVHLSNCKFASWKTILFFRNVPRFTIFRKFSSLNFELKIFFFFFFLIFDELGREKCCFVV